MWCGRNCKGCKRSSLLNLHCAELSWAKEEEEVVSGRNCSDINVRIIADAAIAATADALAASGLFLDNDTHTRAQQVRVAINKKWTIGLKS